MEPATELKNFANFREATVSRDPPVATDVFQTKKRLPKFKRKNNLAFEIFIGISIPIMIYLLLSFIPSFSARVNDYLIGTFKRPLPAHPELYFDVNCINSMTYDDFTKPNQVERCRTLRPINRPGPPTKF